jgi:type VI secretion system protein VasJ
VAKDFFGLGQNIPQLQAMSDWVRKGYGTLAAKRHKFYDPYSYRFWARGGGKETLICGLVRHSTDSIGRPYPLTLIGLGPLLGWENQWDLVPFACERSWSQMERISSKSFEDLKQFDEEVHKVRPPSPQWSDYLTEREKLDKGESDLTNENFGQKTRDLNDRAARFANQTETFIPLDEGLSYDQFTLASLWHSFIKTETKVFPNAVFMGGTPLMAYLALFQRPLTPADFVLLWSVCSEENQTNGSLGDR